MGFLQDVGRSLGFTKSKEQGQAPARKPRVTPLETPEGKELITLLRDRIAGRGTGFTPEFISETASPFAVSERAGLRRETIPAISAQASARGVGRSTIPVSQIGRESSRVEESIANRIANLGRESEILRAGQISEATGRFQNLTLAETSAQNAEIEAANLFNNAEFLRQQGFREQADAAQQQGIQKLIDVALGAATGGAGLLPGITGGFGGAALGGIAGFGGDLTAFAPKTGLFSGADITFPGGKEPGAGVEFASQDAAIDKLNLPQDEKDFLKQAIRVL